MKGQYAFIVLSVSTLTISSASEVTNSISSFTNKLYNTLSTKGTNLIFSPFSAHSALTLTYYGAANETAKNFEKTLDLPSINETMWQYRDIMTSLKSVEDVNIETANKIYLMDSYKLRDDFQAIAENYFQANVDSINFSENEEAARSINVWCKNSTKDKIEQLVSSEDLNDNTRALILNAIYFKGNWMRKFDKALTQKEKFHATQSETIGCDMMYQSGEFEYGEDAILDAQVLRMRYLDDRFAMTIILPNARDGLEKLEELLLHRNLSSFKLEQTDVEVYIPKFKFDVTLDLSGPLSKLGLGEIFTFSADFSNMIETSEVLKVDKVLQKAFIEVNEEGSEAAAITVVEISSRFGGDEVFPEIFLANHPFIFFITAEIGQSRDEDMVLFMGKIERTT